jgi:hypothetical protein
VAVEDIVPDTSALVAYAENDLRALPIDELFDELREDSSGHVILGWFVLEDAQLVLQVDRTALGRLEALASEHGVRFADADMQRAIGLTVAEGQCRGAWRPRDRTGPARPHIMAEREVILVIDVVASCNRIHGAVE